MHQPRATSGAEEAFRLPVAVRARVCCDGAGEGRRESERGEEGGCPVGGGALVAAFGAVADEEFWGSWEGSGEGYEGALAAALHRCECGSCDLDCLVKLVV